MHKISFNPPIIAHRGASGYAPENTLAAFAKAKALGARWVEFDVQLTRDEEVVVFHDAILDRTTHSHGLLIDQSYAELSTLDAGSWFNPQFAQERIPTLAAVLQWLQQEHMAANIELKPYAGQEKLLVQKVLEIVSAFTALPQANLLFSSFSLATLYALRREAKECAIGILMDQWLVDWPELVTDLASVSVHLNYAIANQARIEAIQAKRQHVLCYTINDVKLAAELFSWGVDAVFTDFPDQIFLISHHDVR